MGKCNNFVSNVLTLSSPATILVILCVFYFPILQLDVEQLQILPRIPCRAAVLVYIAN